MSAFKALNVESDNESEDETIDNSKEIQIEEALKIYQTALKYHSEGPRSFDKAAQAYKELFESEIFKYPESLSEFRRHELYGDNLVFDSIFQDDFDTTPAQAGGNDSAPNTLPQILHLSYKNHGQFLLELVQFHMRHQGALPQEQNLAAHIEAALTYFAEALDKDEADLDLWSRTSSVAALRSSRRITRFCLEAVLDGDDENLDSILRLPGVEEGFAGQQLIELVERMEDDVSLAQEPISLIKRKKLSEALKKRLNPYSFAPLPSDAITTTSPYAFTGQQPVRLVLSPKKWNWAGVGEVILNHFAAEQGGYIETIPGSGFAIDIPESMQDAPSSGPNGRAQKAVAASETVEQPSQTGQPEKPSSEESVVSVSKKMEDVVIEDQDKESDKKKGPSNSEVPTESGPALSRKRSTDSAGLPETADGGRVRSKRIRARESTTDATTGQDPTAADLAKQLEDQLSPFVLADQYLFEIINDIFTKLDVERLGSSKDLRGFVFNTSSRSKLRDNSISKAAKDLVTAMQSGDPKIVQVLLSGDAVDLGGMSREAGLNTFLGYAKSGVSQTCAKPPLESERLCAFSQDINADWFSLNEVAFAWVEAMLTPGALPIPSASNNSVLKSQSSYMLYRWGEDLKRHLVQMLVNFDDYLLARFHDRISKIDTNMVNAHSKFEPYKMSSWELSQVEVVETIFELHLDVYSLIKHPHSGVDTGTQTVQSDRLERWALMARDAMQMRTSCHPESSLDELALRHIWASVFHISVSEGTKPEQTVYAMEELKYVFQSIDERTIEVQNNAVMPELSVAAIDRELARISMKDFFLRVFDQDEKDPVAVIESLEPILEPAQQVQLESNQTEIDTEMQTPGPEHVDSRSSSTIRAASVDASQPPSPVQEMKKFLDTASVSLKLSLWQRLREAYEAIEYPAKVTSCYLRSIELLIGEFKSSAFKEALLEERYIKLLGRLRIIDEILIKTLQIIRDDKTAFDCLAYEHLQSSMSAISELLRILTAENMFEDMLRVRQIPSPRFEGCPNGTLQVIIGKFHDLQLRAWILQYHLLKEGILQNSAAFQYPAEDLFEFLRHVHHATGTREFCHAAGRTFLRLAKDEILRLDDVPDGNTRDIELSQVLYDLYGLNTFINTLELKEFKSSPDLLDKKTATQLLSFILSQARKVNIKDLPKTELKVTIDKVHGALGRPKPNDDLALNRKFVTAFLKSPISPVSLYKSLRGVTDLTTKHVSPQTAPAASKGWCFLMGNIALNKFRSQKRVAGGPTEDINFAQAFFMQDLEYSIDNWETWYNLAQANDCQLEEAVSWTAEKLNSTSVELMHFQRASIHCYMMAIAFVIREVEIVPQMMTKISALFSDFGTRMYASSREPFNMHAFDVRDTEQRYFSGLHTQHLYQASPFTPLAPFVAWKFSAALFRRAIQWNPDKWWNHYMLGKALWKMHCAYSDAVATAAAAGEEPFVNKGPGWEDVTEAFINAIDALPGKKDSKRDPVLEPHYKLVSVVHKLVQHKEIDHEKGAEILRHTYYSHNIGAPETADEWQRYVLAVLKALRTADKPGWHHRMTARSADIVYDDPNDAIVALAAKQELSQQIFTKTMAVQVWKPENERPGRHFVYTTRYTRFFIRLLVQTRDRANFEALAKRVRKKPHEFFEHTKLWQELCIHYLGLLRRIGNVPEGYEETVFKSNLTNDEFQPCATRLEAWCQSPNTQHPILDVLREVIELKRMNNGLMKGPSIDELIGDTYALLYSQVGPTLEATPAQQQLQQPQLPQSEGGTPQPSSNVLISTIMNNQVDGTAEGTPNETTPNNPFNTGPAQQQPSAAPTEPVSKPRARVVAKREIQKRAEAAVIKLAAPTSTSTSAAIPIRSPPPHTNAHPQVVIPSRRSTGGGEGGQIETAPNPTRPNNEPNEQQLQVPNNNNTNGSASASGNVTNVESSAPGSMHDSADDESELSELDESEVQEIHQQSDVHDPANPIRPPGFTHLSTGNNNNVDSSAGGTPEPS